MRIFNSVPQNNEIFTHEAPTAKVLIGLTWFFVAISAVTVTAAWNVFLDDLLKGVGAFRWVVLILWALVFVLPIEIMIFELSKYFWRSLIKGYHKGAHAGQFYTAAILLLLGLFYSGFMSQKATRSAMINAAPKEQIVDASEVEAVFNDQVKVANEQYREEAEGIESRNKATKQAIERKYSARLDSLQNEYAFYSSKGEDRYKNRLNNISRAMSAANLSKAKELEKLTLDESTALAALQSERSSAIDQAEELKATNLIILRKKTEDGNGELSAFAAVFSGLISWVAALSVLFVFFLARFIELFYARTGVERVVLSENADLYGSAVFDIARFPFVWVSRHLSVIAAKAYSNLPSPPPPINPEILYDPKGAGNVQQIVHAFGSQPAAQQVNSRGPANPAQVQPMGPVQIQPQAPAPQPTATVKVQPLQNLTPQPVSQFIPDLNTAPTPAPSKTSEPFSLKDSKPEGEQSKVSRKMPAELEELVKAAWKTPVTLPGFYELIGINPAEFSTAFDYLDKLKKTARNCRMATAKQTGRKETRDFNNRRMSALESELGRLCVGIVPGESDASIKFTWLTVEQQQKWEQEIYKNMAKNL